MATKKMIINTFHISKCTTSPLKLKIGTQKCKNSQFEANYSLVYIERSVFYLQFRSNNSNYLNKKRFMLRGK